MDPEARISSKEFVEHAWFLKHGLYRRRATVPVNPDPALDFQKTQNFSPNNPLNSSNPLMARLGSRSVSREPTAHKDPQIHQGHPPQHQSYQSSKVQIFTNTAPNFYPKPQTPEVASLSNAQPASLYQQMRQENASFNQTTQSSFGTPSPVTPVRGQTPKLDFASGPAQDNSSAHGHSDRRNNDSNEVVSSELNRVTRKAQTLQLKSASKAVDSLRLQQQQPTPSISSTNTEARRVQPEVLIFSQPLQYLHQQTASSRQMPGIVISSNRQLPAGAFEQLDGSQSGARQDASPIRKAFGERNTPIKDAIMHARDASPAPTLPHGHARFQVSPDASGVSTSRDPYRPFLAYAPSPLLPANRPPPTDREAQPPLNNFMRTAPLHHASGSYSEAQLEPARPPATPARVRISNTEGEALGLQGEVQALRLKVRELEAENSRLKNRLLGSGAEIASLQSELQELKNTHKHLSFQADFFNKQKQQLQAGAQVGENFEHLKKQLIAFSEAIREKNPGWFVASAHPAQHPHRQRPRLFRLRQGHPARPQRDAPHRHR